jgi:DNA repair protein RadC
MPNRSRESEAARRPPTNAGLEHLQTLDDAELLLLLLGRRRNGEGLSHARELLGFGGGVDGLARLGPALLARHPGLGQARAIRLAAAFELGERRFKRTERRLRIDSLDAVVAWANPRLLPLDHEEMWLLCLDGRNALTSSRRVGQGGLHGCALTAKDILRPALRDGASAIVLIHNHPSGDPSPSPEDIRMTRAVVAACNTIAMPLLDHVIVASEGAASLVALGVIPTK